MSEFKMKSAKRCGNGHCPVIKVDGAVVEVGNTVDYTDETGTTHPAYDNPYIVLKDEFEEHVDRVRLAHELGESIMAHSILQVTADGETVADIATRFSPEDIVAIGAALLPGGAWVGELPDGVSVIAPPVAVLA